MSHLDTAKEIQRQLGGALMMLGAKNLLAHDDERGGLSFRIRGSKKVNYIKIILTQMDLYSVEFGKIGSKREEVLPGIKISTPTYKVTAEHDNIYSDMMKDLIESETGLYTRL